MKLKRIKSEACFVLAANPQIVLCIDVIEDLYNLLLSRYVFNAVNENSFLFTNSLHKLDINSDC